MRLRGPCGACNGRAVVRPERPQAPFVGGRLPLGRRCSAPSALARRQRSLGRGRPPGNRRARASGVQRRSGVRRPDCYFPSGLTTERVVTEKEEKMPQATNLKPKSEKNIAAYGLETLSWDRALARMQEEWKQQAPPEMGGDAYPHTHWLVTTRPDGRPHVTGIGAVWDSGKFYFSSGAGTQKSRNLARNPNCSIALAAKGIDLVVEGTAEKITDNAKLQHVAKVFATGGGGAARGGGGLSPQCSAP